MTVLGELTAIVALAVANGLFAATEIAMLSVRKSQLAERADDGDRAAATALSLRNQPERFLATVQVGITVVSATAAAIGGASLSRHAAAPLRRLGLSPDAADELALASVIVLVSYLSLVVGELVPKSLALRNAERVTLLAARPLAAIASISRPIVWFLTVSSNAVLRLFHDQTSFTESRLSPEELEQLLDEACTIGSLDRRVGEIAIRALESADLRIEAVKTPRAAIVALRAATLRSDLLEALRRAPHADYPVIDDDLEAARGVLSVRDVAALLADPSADLAAEIQPLSFVPESRRALEVLTDMQRTGTRLAFVVDEVGSVTGLVALEDLIEELVGDIKDAKRREAPQIEPRPDGSFEASGQVSLHDLNRAAELSLEEEPGVTTVGGWVIARTGRIPTAGQLLEIDDLTIEILEATPRRIVKVRIRHRA